MYSQVLEVWTWLPLRGYYSVDWMALAFGLIDTLARPMVPLWTLLWCGMEAAPRTKMLLLCPSSWVHWEPSTLAPGAIPHCTLGCSFHVHLHRPGESGMAERGCRPWLEGAHRLALQCGPWTSCICIIWELSRKANLRPHFRPTESGTPRWAQETRNAEV